MLDYTNKPQNYQAQHCSLPLWYTQNYKTMERVKLTTGQRANIFSKMKRHYTLVGVFILLCLFFLLTPKIGDDFMFMAYASSVHDFQSFLAVVSHMYNYTNARLASNSIEFLFVNHSILTAALQSAIVLIIIHSSARVANVRSTPGMALLAVMLLFIPANIFSQTYAWHTGFFNYVIPVAVLLLLLRLVPGVLATDVKACSTYTKAIPVFILSVVGCLFVEHVTILLAALSAVSLIGMLKAKKVDRVKVGMILGVVLGSFIMFSSPIYQNITDGSDGYRQLGSSAESTSLSSVIISSADKAANLLIMQNIILLIAISACCLILIYRFHKGSGYRIESKIASAILILMPIYFVVSSGFSRGDDSKALLILIMISRIISCAAYFTVIFMTAFMYVKDTKIRNQTFLLLAMCLALASPFLIVSPFGPRNFYVTYVLLSILAFVLAKAALRGLTIQKKHLNLASFIAVATLVFMSVIFLVMFTAIKRIELKNDKAAMTQVSLGANTVDVLRYPFGKYLHGNGSSNVKKVGRYYANIYCSENACSASRLADLKNTENSIAMPFFWYN